MTHTHRLLLLVAAAVGNAVFLESAGPIPRSHAILDDIQAVALATPAART